LWIQSQSSNAAFRRSPDSAAYFQLVRWLGFCATELHKQIFRVVFYPEADDGTKDRVRALAPQRFALLDVHLADRAYLLGDAFSAADAYLAWFFVLSDHAVDAPSDLVNLDAYRERVMARPLVRAMIEDDRQKGDEAADLRLRLFDT
jgi:glutathione S-transferase